MDVLQRAGQYPVPPGINPILGVEVAGEVEAKGDKCSSTWQVGDRVMALLTGGGYAEYVVVDERMAMPIPDNLDYVQAAAIPETWLTAYQLLFFIGKLQQGDSVLIHAAGSGVGTAAIQLAVQCGAQVIATAGTDAKLQTAEKLGAKAAINYKEAGDFSQKVLDATEGKGVDVILDCVGGSFWEYNSKAIAMDGRWVLYGTLGGPIVKGDMMGRLLRKRVSLLATTLRYRPDEYKIKLAREFAEHALPLFANGTYAPVVDSMYKLEDVAKAHEKMGANENHGKLLLTL
eukprot:jgi/Chlat1/1302/Chrsp118S08658